jgi:hypothetical protein
VIDSFKIFDDCAIYSFVDSQHFLANRLPSDIGPGHPLKKWRIGEAKWQIILKK